MIFFCFHRPLFFFFLCVFLQRGKEERRREREGIFLERAFPLAPLPFAPLAPLWTAKVDTFTCLVSWTLFEDGKRGKRTRKGAPKEKRRRHAAALSLTSPTTLSSTKTGVSLRVASSPVRSGRPGSSGGLQQTGSAPATVRVGWVGGEKEKKNETPIFFQRLFPPQFLSSPACRRTPKWFHSHALSLSLQLPSRQPSKCSTTSDYGALAAAVAGAAAAGSFHHQQQPMISSSSSTATAAAAAAPLPLFFDDRGRNSSLPLVTPLARPGLLAAPAPPRKNALFESTRVDLGAAMATAAAAADMNSCNGSSATTFLTAASASAVSANEVSMLTAAAALLPSSSSSAAASFSAPPFPRPHPASAPERRGRPPRPPAASRSFARVRVRRTLDMRAGGGNPFSTSSAHHHHHRSSSSSRDPLAPLPAAATKVRFQAAAGRCSAAALPLALIAPPDAPSNLNLNHGSGSERGRRRADTPGCCGGRLAGRRAARRLSDGGTGSGGGSGGAENENANNNSNATAASDAAAGLVAKLSLDAF